MTIKLKRCSVCEKERINIDFNQPIWKSDLKMVHCESYKRDFEFMRFTVCPKCRKKYTLDEIFNILIDKKQKEVLE
ncbi:MAG: hypothetical protein ACOCUI_04655 [bacterium]